ncbi:unnamed protein product, partial [Ectocarpus sp. 12 AP-2014]
MSGSGRNKSTKLDRRSLVIQQRLAWLANSSNWDGKLPSPKKLAPAAAAASAASAAAAGLKTACAEREGMTGGSGYHDNKPKDVQVTRRFPDAAMTNRPHRGSSTSSSEITNK